MVPVILCQMSNLSVFSASGRSAFRIDRIFEQVHYNEHASRDRYDEAFAASIQNTNPHAKCSQNKSNDYGILKAKPFLVMLTLLNIVNFAF